MPRGVPSTCAKCFNCKSVAAKCVRGPSRMAKRSCINCTASNCVHMRNLEPRSPTTGEEEIDHRAIKQQHLCTEKNEIGGYLSNDISQIMNGHTLDPKSI
ncbi:hypothetical protein GJ496_006598 [Pomphorhynchus laevis]|nr:hypothetical protein GJ496_006598 [Pomphorhynchus laevis]